MTPREKELKRLSDYISANFKSRNHKIYIRNTGKEKARRRAAIRDAIIDRRLFDKIGDDLAAYLLRNRTF